MEHLNPDSMPYCPYDWQYREGRCAEGDRFAIHALVHGSGRILAKVFSPVVSDEFVYRATFYCAVPDDIIDAKETFDFIDAESAKVFCEGVLSQFDPLAKPKPKPAVTENRQREPA